MNEIERYLAMAAGRDKVKEGDDVTLKVDLAVAHDVTAPMALAVFGEIGADKVFDSRKVAFVVDHVYPAPTIQVREDHRTMRAFAEKYGLRIFDKGEGVIHQVIAEELQLPRGAVLVAADSHTCTAGAYGVLAVGVGSTEFAATMVTGTLDIEVPPVKTVFLEGNLRPGVFAKDIILHLISLFGTAGFTDQAVAFAGSWVRQAGIEEKMTISNMAIEMGAMLSYFSVEQAIGSVCWEHVVDVGKLVPVVACPSSPGNVRPVAELAGQPVTQVIIGSCTNGRISDMREAAAVFRTAKVNDAVNCLILPASRRVAEAMDNEGLTAVFRQAGAVVGNPGCGPCYGGHLGLAGADDVVVATTNRNFPGRMGAKAAKVFLASPRTAAEAAAAGTIVAPGTILVTGGGSNAG